MAPLRGSGRTAPVGIAQDGEQVLRAQRLGQERALQSAGIAVHHAGSVAVSGNKQNAAAGMRFSDGQRGVNPGHVFHDNIDEQHVGRGLRGAAHGFVTAIRGGGLESALVQDQGKGIGNDRLIVDHRTFVFAGLWSDAMRLGAKLTEGPAP